LIGDFTSYNEDGSIKMKGFAHKDGRLEDKTPVNISYAEVNKSYKCKCCKKTIKGILDAYSVFDQLDGEGSSMRFIKDQVKDGSMTSKSLHAVNCKTIYDYLRMYWFPYCTMKCDKMCG